MSEAIRIKPHHFIDIITSYGRGTLTFSPHPYGHAVHSVAETILSGDDVVLEMNLGADDICKPCVHNVEGTCDDTIDTSFRPDAPSSKQEWNLRVDRRWCERLGLAEGDRLTRREFCERVRDRGGDLEGIYPEEPAERSADRERNLKEGVRRLLG